MVQGVSYADTQAQNKLYDFEDGTAEGWAGGWGDALVSAEISDDLSVPGNTYSLKVNTNFSGTDWQTAAVRVSAGFDLTQYASVAYDVYVPASFDGTLGLETDLNGEWLSLGFENKDIRELRSAPVSINGSDYVAIHETAIIPKDKSGAELVIQLQKNMDLAFAGPIYLDNVELSPRAPEPPSHEVGTVMARDAVIGGVGPEFKTDRVGDIPYDGEGYISFFYPADDPDHPGSAAFHVNVTAMGLYKLVVGYYAPYGDKGTTLFVNGQSSGEAHLPAPPEGKARSEFNAGKVLLQAGDNTIGFGRNWGYYGIEYIRLESTAPAGDVIEAEDGTVEASAAVKSDIGGYSGSGYVSFSDSGSLTLKYAAASAGLYELAIGYHSPFGNKDTSLNVNGEPGMNITLAQTTEFTEMQAGKVSLNEGENEFRFEPGWGWYNIDYIKLTSSAPPKQHGVTKELVNPNATPEAKALFGYLVDNYGKKILSGQQDLENSQWIYDQTGKYPAITSFDLIDYSPSRVEHGATSTQVEKMMEWAGQGGLVALCWHWNAPTGLFGDEVGKEWWRGFYTDATTFNVKTALENPDSDDYQLLLRDIDAIAVQLKRLQDAHIPVLWRPLHEAEGGWFWWGAQGPGPAKELYRLMYDRLTNVHHLNNLIWVWNSVSPDWYPGDDAVDVVSTDIYNHAGDYSASSNKFDALISLTGDKKLVALPENGPIPDPDLLQAYAADWSWFSTWSGDFIRDGVTNTADHLKRVFGSDYVITRDELPSDLNTYVPPSDPGDGSNVGYTPVTVTDPKQKVVTSADLKPGSEGIIKLALAGGQTELVFPQELVSNIGESVIEVDFNGLLMELPAAVLKSLISEGQTGNGKIILNVEKLTATEADKLQSGIVHRENEHISPVGDVFDIEFAFQAQDGQAKPIQPSGPVTVKFPVPDGIDTAGLGVYFIDDEGRMEYVRGVRNGSYIESQLQHFSKYALLNVQVSFVDVPATYWASAAIAEMAARQLFPSAEEAAFLPGKTVTRGELAAVLAKAIGLKAQQASTFTDVDPESDSAGYIAAAHEAGLVLGVNGSEFKPESPLTREQLAVVIKRACLFLAQDAAAKPPLSGYIDRDRIASWAVDAVDFDTAKGLFQGREDKSFAPSESVTRAELAQVVLRFLSMSSK